jgi:hypothetical protein
MRNGMKQFYQSYDENTKLSPMVREIGWTKKPKINKSIYVNNELKRKRTNSNCVSSFHFVPVRCLNYLINRTRIRRYPCVSASSAQSVFHRIPSAFICVHLRLIFVSLSDRTQKIKFELFPVKEKIELSNNNQVHSWLNLLKNKPQMNADERRFVNLNIQHLSEVYQGNSRIKSPQRAQSIATIIFASFTFTMILIKILNKLSNIVVLSALIRVHPQLIDRMASAEGR